MKAIVIGLVLGMGAAVAFGGDDDKPFEQEKAELKQDAEKEVKQLRPIKASKLADVMQFAIEGNDLALRTTLAPTDGYAQLNVDDVGGLPAKVSVQAITGTSGTAFSMIHSDFTPADAVIVMTTIFSVPQVLQVSRDEERLAERRNVQLIQSDQYLNDGSDKIKLYINVSKKMTGEVVTDLKLSAANILDLRRKYPAEVARFIEPIFRDLHQESILAQVDPKLAWQVFAPLYKPDAQIAAKVGTLVKKLDSEAFRDRETASKELTKMGAPAALILLSMKRGGMSDEQQTRIDAIVAAYKPLPDEEAGKLRADKFFLLDCLYCEDQQVRQWAVAELNKSLGQPVGFDLAVRGAQRDAAVAKLREQVLRAMPTTMRAATTRPS